MLRDDKPDDISIEQPTKFALVINTKTAEALGPNVPGTAKAAAVIECGYSTFANDIEPKGAIRLTGA